jgi:oligoribonuclease NrnB/cAMP/cGMP phosphodiesterase (DHH superfamily)
MKVLVIADRDLDGSGSAAIINLYHKVTGDTPVTVQFPMRNNLNAQFKDANAVKKLAIDYDLIYLCDTGVDSSEGIRNLTRILGPKLIYFDHHQTNYEGTKANADNFLGYHVIEGDRCTAKIAFDVLLESLSPPSSCDEQLEFKEAAEFAMLVNDLDMWIRNYERSSELGDIVAVLGPDHAYLEFEECVTNAYHNSEIMQEAIETARMRKFKSLQLAKETLVKHKGYKAPLYTAICRGYGSEVSHKLVHDEGLIVLYDTTSGTMSLRRGDTVNTKDSDVNCLDFANLFGGGGHPFAAGFPAEKVLKQMSQVMGQYMIKEWKNE